MTPEKYSVPCFVKRERTRVSPRQGRCRCVVQTIAVSERAPRIVESYLERTQTNAECVGGF